jgi:hydroxyacylglutathione hydrolase
MLLKYFYDKKLAQSSYLVGCAKTGEALIVDPMRDITPYLQATEAEDLRITHITETHIHADYVSGSRELAAHTGARMFLSDMGDDYWKYAFADDNTTLLRDGDQWMVGNIRIEVVHTPGHTPEHISLLVTDTAGADQPIGMFTGDFLFVGDVGRPDLLEEAAGMAGTKEVGARQQFRTIERIKSYADYLQIWPGHGAGSACGKALGAIPSTTLGYEKLFNPAFQFEDEDAFVEWLLDGQPEAPRYFAQMKQLNREGPALIEDLQQPQLIDRAGLDALRQSGAQIFDLREQEHFLQAHLPATIHTPYGNGSFVNHLGWFVDYSQPVYFIVHDETPLDAVTRAARDIGVDVIGGCYAAGPVLEGGVADIQEIGLAEFEARFEIEHWFVLDVRNRTEHNQQHIEGAYNIPMGHIPRRLDEIPKDRPIVTHCASGYRSLIAASVLVKHGFDNVINLRAEETDWAQLLEVERG